MLIAFKIVLEQLLLFMALGVMNIIKCCQDTVTMTLMCLHNYTIKEQQWDTIHAQM